VKTVSELIERFELATSASGNALVSHLIIFICGSRFFKGAEILLR
jgi:hypothetical protein